jgi:putative polyketide hydroxylase
VAIHDLFDRELVLLTGREGKGWIDAAAALRDGRSLPVTSVQIAADGHKGNDDVVGEFTEKYGIDQDGAVLVRPDGVIAWRSPKAATEPAVELARVLARLGVMAS